MTVKICPNCNHIMAFNSLQDVTHIKCVSCGRVWTVKELNNDGQSNVALNHDVLSEAIDNIGMYYSNNSAIDSNNVRKILNDFSEQFHISQELVKEILNMYVRKCRYVEFENVGDYFTDFVSDKVEIEDLIKALQEQSEFIQENVVINAYRKIQPKENFEMTRLSEKVLFQEKEIMRMKSQMQQLTDRIANLNAQLEKYK